MNAAGIGSIVNVKTCSYCQGNTEYHCHSCQQDLCRHCKEEHIRTHHVTIYRERFYSGYKQEVCEKHPGQLVKKYCDSCLVSLCNKCRLDTAHNIIDVRSAYKTKREQTMYPFLSETIYTMRILHSSLYTEVNAYKRMIFCRKSEMVVKAQRLQHVIDEYSHHWLKKLRMLFSMQIVRILKYENKYQKYAIKPVQFLQLIKGSKLPQKTDTSTCYITRYYLLPQTQKINMMDVTEYLSEIQVIGTKKRQVVNWLLPTLMPATDLIRSLSLDIQNDSDISHFVLLHPDRIWVCSYDKLFLADTKSGAVFQKYYFGSNFEHLFDTRLFGKQPFGKHTINLENELICIDGFLDIIKISKDENRTIIKKSTHQWKPSCVYFCPSTGDLLVGLSGESMGKVTLYHNARHSTQTTGYEETDYVVSHVPNFITENNNGDVVVSCVDFSLITQSSGYILVYGTIQVLEHDGRHRFTYEGPPCGPKLKPVGICTDPLSNILVCDRSSSVQIVDKNGLFLFYLHTGIKQPFTLQYDTYSNMLWVGNREGNILYNMRYLSRQGLQPTRVYPKYALLKGFKLQNVCRCLHISGVNEERAWVSDLVSVSLADITSGKILCSLEVLCDQSFTGHYSVNREGELFYIDVSLNIAKFSIYSQSIEIFLKEAKSSWKPQCLYCSLYTEELLVAIRFMDVHAKKDLAMLIRYDKTGKVKQIMQYNNHCQDLYIFPRFITENSNGDVVVSDKYNGVVVTSHEGRHRFSYTGPQSGSRFDPWGICTDAHSHILVCDGYTSAVQIIDSDGQFLSFLPTKHLKLDIKPFSLSYDISNLLLYVGSIDSKMIHVFRDTTQYTDYYKACYSNSEDIASASLISS